MEVLTSKTMEQRGDTSVTSVVSKAAGIQGGVSGHGPGGRFSVRGFSGFPGINFLNDGVKIKGSAFSNRALEVANLDRIEIIRGASSVLNGEGSIGATVNLITKKPSFTKEETEFGFKLGSYDSYRFNFGRADSIVEDKLAYRIDVSTREIGSNINNEKRDIDSLSASLLYKVNDSLLTSVLIEKYKDDTKDAYIGTPLINGKLDKSARKINYNVAKNNIEKGENLYLKHNIEWYPSSNLELKNQIYYQDIKADLAQAWSTLQSKTNPNEVVIKNADIGQKEDIVGNRLDLLQKGNIFGLENRFLVGSDISKMNYIRDTSVAGGFNYITNIYNPIRKSYQDVGGTYKDKNIDVSINQISLYMEDQLNLTDNFKFVVGARYDNFDGKWKYLRQKQVKDKTFDGMSYRTGFVYDITDTTTFYSTYSRAIEAGNVMVLLNSKQLDLDLTKAQQYEVGLRQSFLDNKAEFSASVYKINKKNMFVNDPNNIGKILNAGKQSSKGFELAFGISPIEQIQIDANLAYIDAKFDDFVDGVNNLSGNIPNSVPKHIANFGIRYMPISNLGIGTWVRYVDSFYVDDANSVKLPSYTTVDLTLDYTYNKNTTFSFLLKNLTDELYATTGRNRVEVFLGDARSFEFGVNYKF